MRSIVFLSRGPRKPNRRSLLREIEDYVFYCDDIQFYPDYGHLDPDQVDVSVLPKEGIQWTLESGKGDAKFPMSTEGVLSFKIADLGASNLELLLDIKSVIGGIILTESKEEISKDELMELIAQEL